MWCLILVVREVSQIVLCSQGANKWWTKLRYVRYEPTPWPKNTCYDHLFWSLSLQISLSMSPPLLTTMFSVQCWNLCQWIPHLRPTLFSVQCWNLCQWIPHPWPTLFSLQCWNLCRDPSHTGHLGNMGLYVHTNQLGLLGTGKLGCREFLYLHAPTRYTVTTRMTLH